MKATTLLMIATQIAVAGLAGCTYEDAEDCGGLEVSNVWIREAPPAAGVQAGYFEAFNSAGKGIVVHAVQSPDFARVEMHETVSKDGRTSMQALDSLHIPPRSGAEFKAGGKHLMLFQPRLRYEDGDRVQLEFTCGVDRARTVVKAEVRSAKPVRDNVSGK